MKIHHHPKVVIMMKEGRGENIEMIDHDHDLARDQKKSTDILIVESCTVIINFPLCRHCNLCYHQTDKTLSL